MKVIVRDAKRAGHPTGSTIQVKDGYAMNYLIPQGIAYPLSEAHEKIMRENLRQASSKALLIKKQAVELAKVIRPKTFTLSVQAGDQGKIFGSVTPQQIAEAVNQQMGKHILKADQVVINEPITYVKAYVVTLKLHTNVQTDVMLQIAVAK